ncbi:hypothetical protein SOX05_08435 [Pseudomonas putida]|nr:hypothetical protein [Pseudomonas putida]MDY4319287.1 hypothetical protein [Pseudomonas putida]MDY4352672.1 hypothetical protein [Pseudomonas putida]
MLSMISTGIYALTQSSSSLAQKQQTDEYVNEIKIAKNSVLALSTTFTETTEDDQVIKYAALPAGTPSGEHNLLPSPIIKKKNVYNKDIIYCPFAAKISSTFTAEINGGPSAKYDVETRQLTKNNRTLDYVVGNADNNFTREGILGVIISPHYLAKGPLNCNELIYSNENQSFRIEGGRVETITALEIEAVNLN